MFDGVSVVGIRGVGWDFFKVEIIKENGKRNPLTMEVSSFSQCYMD